MITDHKPVLRFGRYELNQETGELRKSGTPLKIAPQPFKVLALLASRTGELVSREEIRQQVWGDATFVDFDQGLNFCIRQIRAVLLDDADQPRYIETLPRRGYRFVGPMSEVKDPSPKVPAAPGAAPVTAPVAAPVVPASRRRLVLALAAAGFVAIAGIVSWFALRPRPAPDIASILVLPFRNLSPDKDNEFFSDGITEEIISALTRVPGLRVTSRMSSFALKATHLKPQDIGAKLHVASVLEGTVQRADGRIRITAQLIDTANDRNLLSLNFDRPGQDVFAVQDDISRAIAGSLKLKLAKGWTKQPSKNYTEDIETYNLYLKGRFFFNQSIESARRKSIEYFEAAVQRDPGFAPAYAGIAEAHVMGTVRRGQPGPSVAEAHQKAKAAARKAVDLDPTLAEAHSALAHCMWRDWEWKESEQEFRRAIDLEPDYASAHVHYAGLLTSLGRHDEAIREAQLAVRLEPLSVFAIRILGQAFFYARRYDDAIAQCKKALDLDRDFVMASLTLARAYLEKGMYDEAMATYRASKDRNGATFPELLAYILVRSGQREQARKFVAGLQGERDIMDAQFYATVGENHKALAALMKAVEKHTRGVLWLKVAPQYDSLRADPGFIALLKRLGLTS